MYNVFVIIILLPTLGEWGEEGVNHDAIYPICVSILCPTRNSGAFYDYV